MTAPRPTRVVVVGGGCAAIAAAFELTRPEHEKAYRVTVYQAGWRLGGKGASGRGPGGRIEEHGLHVWLGYYENAFKLLRECYAELNDRPQNRAFADWRDAFFPDAHIGISEESKDGAWAHWAAQFPPMAGLPGDPAPPNPVSLRNYIVRATVLLRTLLLGVETTKQTPDYQRRTVARQRGDPAAASPEAIIDRMTRLLRYGLLATAAAAAEALALVEVAIKSIAAFPENVLRRLIESVAASVRSVLETVVATDDEVRRRWEIVDLVLAILVGTVRFGLLSNPRGLDAINHYDCREWLRLNGASERALNSAFLRGLYDLAFAYESGDANRPRLAAGEAMRGGLRMFFSYRGALFWKMRAGMGDVVFAPFYEVLRRRGVEFKFFHRLADVKLADVNQIAEGEKPYVAALEFSVQANMRQEADYQPLIDVNGVACWPSAADYAQLENGAEFESEGRDFESHWDRRKVATRTLHVTRDFDFVVLGLGIGGVPDVCKDILARDPRWRAMVANVKTVATQSFQVWLREDLQQLGWETPPVTLSAFGKPFDTWSDMGHLVPAEDWRNPPQTIAYFCSVLADPPDGTDLASDDYRERSLGEVRSNAVGFLEQRIRHLWPRAINVGGEFRWELLADVTDQDDERTAAGQAGESRFNTQYWTANVNPSDRYTLCLPGSIEHRISPLDNTYDNLTIAGDWTDCGFNHGCVEAAVMSGRLAAHAIAGFPPLEDIVGFDHP